MSFLGLCHEKMGMTEKVDMWSNLFTLTMKLNGKFHIHQKKKWEIP